MTSVLITDAEQRSSLAAVRSLGRAGREVVVCSSDSRPLAGASRYCTRAYLVADPYVEPEAFQQGIVDAADDSGARVLLPMTDVSVPLVLGLRETHPELVIPHPELEDYLAISDKAHVTRVAAELGIPVPEQCTVERPSEVSDVDVGDLGFPLFIKPSRSAVDTPTGTVRLAVRMVSSRSELDQVAGEFPTESYPLLLQKRIVGPGLGVFLLWWDGATVAVFAHRRLREKPPTGGVSTYRVSVSVRDDLLEYSERLLHHFRWRGAAMVEFKEDATTGTPYFMEVNGRFWGSLQLGIDANADFPELLVRLASGESVEPPEGYRLGLRSRWLWGELDHLLWILRAPRGYRRGNSDLPSRLRAIARFLVPWRPGDRLEVLRFSDPKPFLRESAAWFRALGDRA